MDFDQALIDLINRVVLGFQVMMVLMKVWSQENSVEIGFDMQVRIQACWREGGCLKLRFFFFLKDKQRI